MQTKWNCELCGKSGTISHSRHLDMWSGYQKVMDAHTEASPNCEGDLYNIRVSLLESNK